MPEIDNTRQLPFAQSAEQAILGCVFLDPNTFPECAEALVPEDFHLPQHRLIFTAMRDMFAKNKEIDTVTLINALRESGDFEKAGGNRYIAELSRSVPTAANIGEYIKIVKDKALLRRLIDVCSDISETAYTEKGNVDKLMGEAEQKMYDISHGNDSGDFKLLKNVIWNVIGNLEQLAQNPEKPRGVQSGFSSVDRKIVGFGEGDMVLIGARPGMGKTSFALNIAANVAKSTKKTVCIFSLEMPAEQLVMRMLSSEAMVENYQLRSGKLSADEWERLAHASSAFENCDIRIDDTSAVSVSKMRAKLRRIKNAELGLVVVDYLQLMTSDKKTDSRVNEVSDISRNIKLMAKDFGIPIICCAQLSRGPEQRKDSEGGKRPMLSDLRESGSIEQDADMVLMLYSPDYYDKSKEEDAAPAPYEVIIAKNRHGSTGTIKMAWVPKYTQFRVLDETHAEA